MESSLDRAVYGFLLSDIGMRSCLIGMGFIGALDLWVRPFIAVW
jgi:hypothetical protein